VRGFLVRDALSVALDFRLDYRAAQGLAETRGLPYQTYMKMLLHQAIEKELRAS
jgi:hypothetical protein